MWTMENWMILSLMIVSVVMFLVTFFLLIYKVFAPRNMFFTFGKENRIMHVMIGGKFSGKIIFPSKAMYVDKKDKYNIKKYENIPPILRKKIIAENKSFSIVGMYWIGFYPFKTIYTRKQKWVEWNSTSKGREMRFRDEDTPYLIAVPFEYIMFLAEAEDENGVPLNVYFTVILVPINALTPIFGNEDAYEQIQTLCIGEALLFVKTTTFADLGSGNVALNSKKGDFSRAICDLNKKIPGRFKNDPNNPNNLLEVGIEEALGYKILDAKLYSVEIAGEHKKTILEATTKGYIAEQEKKAQILKAEGTRDSDMIIAQGEATRLEVKRKYLDDISKIPGAMKVEERKATPGLTTLVESGSEQKTNLLIGGK